MSPARRRAALLAALAALVAILGLGLAMALPDAAPALGWTAGALALAGLAGAAYLFWKPRPAAPSPRPTPAPAQARAPAPDDEGPPVLEQDVFHLRCGQCGTTFDVVDTGERPLVHSCPGCGRRGVLPRQDMSARREKQR